MRMVAQLRFFRAELRYLWGGRFRGINVIPALSRRPPNPHPVAMAGGAEHGLTPAAGTCPHPPPGNLVAGMELAAALLAVGVSVAQARQLRDRGRFSHRSSNLPWDCLGVRGSPRDGDLGPARCYGVGRVASQARESRPAPLGRSCVRQDASVSLLEPTSQIPPLSPVPILGRQTLPVVP